MTPEELKQHDGSDPSIPLYLALVGKVYDVSAGRKTYVKRCI
jgi:predicted heme/steroid binding protein